jgi:hypothetical protein
MLAEGLNGISAGNTAVLAGAAQYMVGVLPEKATFKAASINFVVKCL